MQAQQKQDFWAEEFPYEGRKDIPLLLIRGTDTIGTDFPSVADVKDVEVLWEGQIATPYPKGGTKEQRLSPRFQHIRVGERTALVFPAHGWRFGEDPVLETHSTEKIFWICMNAGSHWGIGGGTVGSLNNAVLPGDAVVTFDVDDNCQKGRVVGLPGTKYNFVRFQILLRMKQAICPSIARHLSDVAKESKFQRVYSYDDELVHTCTDGPWFETATQVRRLRKDGDIVGQSFIDEVRMARLLGIHWAGFHYSVNPAEGQKPNSVWHLDDTHAGNDVQAAIVELKTLMTMPLTEDCGCMSFRGEGRPARYLKDLV